MGLTLKPLEVAVVEVEIGSSQSKATPRQISTLCNKVLKMAGPAMMGTLW